jgi:hypothetical protein
MICCGVMPLCNEVHTWDPRLDPDGVVYPRHEDSVVVEVSDIAVAIGMGRCGRRQRDRKPI